MKEALFTAVSLVFGIILMQWMPHGPFAKFATFLGFIWFCYFLFYDRRRIRDYFRSLLPMRWLIPVVFIVIIAILIEFGFEIDIEHERFTSKPLWHTFNIFMWLIIDFFIGLGINWNEYKSKL